MLIRPILIGRKLVILADQIINNIMHVQSTDEKKVNSRFLKKKLLADPTPQAAEFHFLSPYTQMMLPTEKYSNEILELTNRKKS